MMSKRTFMTCAGEREGSILIEAERCGKQTHSVGAATFGRCQLHVAASANVPRPVFTGTYPRTEGARLPTHERLASVAPRLC